MMQALLSSLVRCLDILTHIYLQRTEGRGIIVRATRLPS